MQARTWLTAAALGVGLALLGAAVALARPASPSGGTFRINLVSDTDYVDPALSYYSVGWELEYATCLKLLNYPDAPAPEGSQLVPEAAASMPLVSRDGRTYTFELRRGLRSNLGHELTAANFAWAINRVLNPKMQSPGGAFIRDVVGAESVLDGKLKSALGVVVRSRYELQITMTKAASDLPARLAMPFFCAVPRDLRIVPEGVNTLESWGPYYVAQRVPNRSILLERNRNYSGPRPHDPDAIAYRVGVNQDASLQEIERGVADYAADGLAPTVYASLGARYGVNRRRFFVRPLLGVRFLRLNLDRPLFRDNPQLRRAVNLAIDRPEILRQYGAFAGRRTDQLLPFGMRGFRDVDLYPLKGADVARARELAAGRTREGKAVMYTCSHTACLGVAQIVKFDLAQIGLEVEVKVINRYTQFPLRCDEPYDIYLDGWVVDYADPRDMLDPAPTPLREFGRPLSCIADRALARDFAAADALPGPRRYRALAELDAKTMRTMAPVVPIYDFNRRFLVSARTRSVVDNPVYGLDLAALRVR